MQVRPDQFDDSVEGGDVADGQLAEHFAIELDGGGDEPVVVDAALLEGGVQARDPEGAEVALALAAVAGGVGVGLAGELDGRAILGAWGVGEAFGAPEDAFTFAGVSGAAGCAGHRSILLESWSQRHFSATRGMAWL